MDRNLRTTSAEAVTSGYLGRVRTTCRTTFCRMHDKSLPDASPGPDPRPPRPRYEFVDARTLRESDDTKVDVFDAIDALPWTPQLCPFMRHEYAITSKSPAWAWYAVEAMIRLNPDAYRAYFRGYPRPNRYWEAPDGLRYWRGRFEIDRCTPESVEPPRRLDHRANPARDWDGPPWAPYGIGLYAQDAKGRWWARFEGTDLKPCLGCQRRPKDVG